MDLNWVLTGLKCTLFLRLDSCSGCKQKRKPKPVMLKRYLQTDFHFLHRSLHVWIKKRSNEMVHLIFIYYSSNSRYFDIIVSIIIEKLRTCCRKKPKWGDNMQVMIGKVLPIKLICAGICSALATGKSFRYFFYQVEARWQHISKHLDGVI